MKPQDIQVGKTYSNGKLGVRRVIDAGAHLASPRQFDTDVVSYAVVRGRREFIDKGMTAGGEQIMHCTRASFAAWAKAELPDGGGLEMPLAYSTHRLIGRTITAVDASCCNKVVLSFDDGGKVALHIDCDGLGLPSVDTCVSCA